MAEAALWWPQKRVLPILFREWFIVAQDIVIIVIQVSFILASRCRFSVHMQIGRSEITFIRPSYIYSRLDREVS